MLDFAALVEDDLGQSPDISQFFVLDSKVFSGVNDFFSLFLDDRLVLVTDLLLLLFEFRNDLRQTFL